jgi:hypothetical protein
MQLAKPERTMVMGGNVGETTDFTIDDSGEMFRLLSDTMYQFKIPSLVREVSSNCLDSHIENGTPKLPFEIHVPTKIEPYIAFTDYGVGLSPEQIKNVFTKFGKSTKGHNNNVIGAFGLGAKTPFAYADQFQIQSVFNGVKTIYSVGIAQDNKPFCTPISVTETSEHNGVVITVPVEIDDIPEFNREIINQLQFFDVKPILTNNVINLKYPDLSENITFDDGESVLYSDAPHSNNFEITITQGGVGYVLNTNGLSDDASNIANQIENYHAVLKFDIGQISVTGSRETLSYDQITIKNIENRLVELSRTLSTDAVSRIRNAETVFERCGIYNEQITLCKDYIKSLNDVDELFIGASIYRHESFIRLDYAIISGIDTLTYKRKRVRSRVGPDYHRMDSEERGSSVPTGDHIIFMIKDISTTWKQRVRQYLLDDETCDQDTIIVMISGFDTSNLEKGERVELNLKHIALLYGIKPEQIIRVSDLPKPVRVYNSGSSYAGAKRAKAYKKDIAGSIGYTSKEWGAVYDLDDVEDAIFIVSDRHNLMYNAEGFKYKLFMELYSNNVFDNDIISINERTYNRLQSGKIELDAVHWLDFVNGYMDMYNDGLATYSELLKYSSANCNSRMFAKARMIPGLENDVAVKLTGIIESRIEKLKGDLLLPLNIYTTMLDYDDVLVRKAKNKGEYIAEYIEQRHLMKYPLLKELSIQYIDNDKMDAVTEYIELINGKGA